MCLGTSVTVGPLFCLFFMGSGRRVCAKRIEQFCVVSSQWSTFHLHEYIDRSGRLRLRDAKRKLVEFRPTYGKRVLFLSSCDELYQDRSHVSAGNGTWQFHR